MRQAVVVLNLLAVLTAGCRSSAPHPYPQDPLFQSKQPVEKAAAAPGPVLFAAVSDPQPPAFPMTALVAPLEDTGKARVAGTLVAGPKRGPVVLQRALRSKATAPGEPNPSSFYGQAPDGSWLQGVLEKHYQGTCYLRFGDPSLSDPCAGQVQLEQDPRLAAFQDGAIVRVEGVLVPEMEVGPGRTRAQPPLYHIHKVQRLGG